jgi:transketolase
MEIPVYVFTRLHRRGRDGPTHQPVERLPSLRAIPGLITIRPADASEVVEAWRVIMRLQHSRRYSSLSRRALPASTAAIRPNVAWRRAPTSSPRRGAGADPGRERKRGVALLEESGSRPGIRTRVVSMPSWLFGSRAGTVTIAPAGGDGSGLVEQASMFGWERYVGPSGRRSG